MSQRNLDSQAVGMVSKPKMEIFIVGFARHHT